MNEQNLLARAVGELLLSKGLKLTVAESCTGGGVAYAITDIAGSSAWFERGFVTYTNIAKQEMLGVKEATLIDNGAVSEDVVVEMAQGALSHSHAQYSLAISGIAGPSGATENKPVGMVCFAWAGMAETLRTKIVYFKGDREAVREQSIVHALRELLAFMTESD